jgi:hypothetical protein
MHQGKQPGIDVLSRQWYLLVFGAVFFRVTVSPGGDSYMLFLKSREDKSVFTLSNRPGKSSNKFEWAKRGRHTAGKKLAMYFLLFHN